MKYRKRNSISKKSWKIKVSGSTARKLSLRSSASVVANGCPAHAWCVVDLRCQLFLLGCFKQRCQKCEHSAKPNYGEDSKRKMAQYAVKHYLIKVGRIQRPQRKGVNDTWVRGEQDQPHDEKRCDMCKILGSSCWKGKATIESETFSALDEENIASRLASFHISDDGNWLTYRITFYS